MSITMRRMLDDSTQIRTNERYLTQLLDNCKFAKHIKTTRMGSTYILPIDMHDIPDSYTELAKFLDKELEDK